MTRCLHDKTRTATRSSYTADNLIAPFIFSVAIYDHAWAYIGIHGSRKGQYDCKGKINLELVDFTSGAVVMLVSPR